MKKFTSMLLTVILATIMIFPNATVFAATSAEFNGDADSFVELYAAPFEYEELNAVPFEDEEAKELLLEVSPEAAQLYEHTSTRNPRGLESTQITLDSLEIATMQDIASAQELESSYLLGGFSEGQAGIDMAPHNTNPNLAIHIPDSLFGLELHDLANHQERWYSFDVPANRKISIALQHQGGDYDLFLFRLDGFTLTLVEFAATGDPLERISYVSVNGGLYFLMVTPFIAAPVPHFFTFIIDVLSGFDAHEPNDFWHQATQRNNSISVFANLDNRFDEDWFKLSVTNTNRPPRQIAVFNAPVGHYAVFVYDSNLNIIGSFMADGQSRTFNFSAGDYYIQVRSLTGHRVATNYRLIVTNANQRIYNHNGQVHILNANQHRFIHNGVFHILNPGQETFIHNGVLHILNAGQRTHIHNGVVHIYNEGDIIRSVTGAGGVTHLVSIIDNQLFIDGYLVELEGVYRQYELGHPINRRYSRDIRIHHEYDARITADNWTPRLASAPDYRFGLVISVNISEATLHRVDTRFWPISRFFTTQPRWGADNEERIDFLNVDVSLVERRVVQAWSGFWTD